MLCSQVVIFDIIIVSATSIVFQNCIQLRTVICVFLNACLIHHNALHHSRGPLKYSNTLIHTIFLSGLFSGILLTPLKARSRTILF